MNRCREVCIKCLSETITDQYGEGLRHAAEHMFDKLDICVAASLAYIAWKGCNFVHPSCLKVFEQSVAAGMKNEIIS